MSNKEVYQGYKSNWTKRDAFNDLSAEKQQASKRWEDVTILDQQLKQLREKAKLEEDLYGHIEIAIWHLQEAIDLAGPRKADDLARASRCKGVLDLLLGTHPVQSNGSYPLQEDLDEEGDQNSNTYHADDSQKKEDCNNYGASSSDQFDCGNHRNWEEEQTWWQGKAEHEESATPQGASEASWTFDGNWKESSWQSDQTANVRDTPAWVAPRRGHRRSSKKASPARASPSADREVDGDHTMGYTVRCILPQHVLSELILEKSMMHPGSEIHGKMFHLILKHALEALSERKLIFDPLPDLRSRYPFPSIPFDSMTARVKLHGDGATVAFKPGTEGDFFGQFLLKLEANGICEVGHETEQSDVWRFWKGG